MLIALFTFFYFVPFTAQAVEAPAPLPVFKEELAAEPLAFKEEQAVETPALLSIFKEEQTVETPVPLPVFKEEQLVEPLAPLSVFKEEQPMSNLIMEDLNQWHGDPVLDYFLDIVFENSFCKCEGNNGCTRGCRMTGLLDKEQYPPFRKCAGRKAKRNSTAKCARHVTGAIMASLHDFSAGHCQNAGYDTTENITEYQQCVDNFKEDVRNNNINICRHGFRFPSALCMLNLDGQNPRIYNSISNKNVRTICKNWDRYNQSLLSIKILLYDDEFVSIPLFKRLPPERNTEFQREPHKIPVGAIIITKSYLKHGHIEVKTDRRECGKNKTQTCFCSDYCRERARYYQPVLAVFEWNPEFTRFLSRSDFFDGI